MSMGSKMRTIITYLAEPPTGEYLKNLMTNARGVLGYPGCGKSTQIGKMIGNNDVALAMNSEAVDSLSRKASHTKAIVCSVEKATQLIKTNKANLFIDEATMIDYVMLAPIVKHGFSKLHIYGDNLQIDFIDMNAKGGVRKLVNLFYYAKQDNLEYNKIVRRFGQPFADHLKILVPDM